MNVANYAPPVCPFSIQAKGVIEHHCLKNMLLPDAARTGNIEVWKIVVEAVRAVRKGLLKEVRLA